jgi:O-antigen/teichoic acid export membrane protein
MSDGSAAPASSHKLQDRELIGGLVRIAQSERKTRLNALFPAAARYGLTSFGPVSISAAHFLISLMALRALPRADFGIISFLLTTVPLALSISGALVGASASRVHAPALDEAPLASHLKVNLLFSIAVGVVVFGLLRASYSDVPTDAAFAIYAGLMTLRWFGRNVGYVLRTPVRVTISDIAYAGTLVAVFGALFALQALSILHAAEGMLAAAAVGLAALGRDYLPHILRPARSGSLGAFRPIWRDLARWSVLGVCTTELTVNAHVYLVTFLFGPAAFALLAAGSLLMRPAALILTALPERERPEIARRIGAGHHAEALRAVKEFRTAAGAVWLATVILAGAMLMVFPHLILKHGYDERQILAVLAFWIAISAVRVARTPDSVLLQAAGEFQELAGASLWSSLASLALTLVLALCFGPIASLGGVLLGDLTLTGRILSLSRAWRRAHA